MEVSICFFMKLGASELQFLMQLLVVLELGTTSRFYFMNKQYPRIGEDWLEPGLC